MTCPLQHVCDEETDGSQCFIYSWDFVMLGDVMRLWPVQVIMRVELLYGLAGLVGSLVSGHLYLLLGSSLGNGTLLLIASIVLHALSLIQAVVLLKVSVCSPVSFLAPTWGDGSSLCPVSADFRRTPLSFNGMSFLLGEKGSDRRAGGGPQPPLSLQP